MAQNNNQNSRKSITGTIAKVIFLDSKTGRSILSVLQENGKPCRVIGNISGIEKDSCITATGSWHKDEKYGWEFMAETIEVVPETEEHAPVEDGLIHALDFSNVLNKQHKELRNVVLDYEYDDFDDEEGEDDEDVEVAPETVSRLTEKEENEVESKQDSSPKREKCECVVDPNGVICIKDSAYRGRSSISTFEIPQGVSHIGEHAFEKCTALTDIELPNSVTSIGRWAFFCCSALSSIKLPEGLESIEDWAFAHCTSLRSTKIPDSVKRIGEGAFYGCSSLSIDFSNIGNIHIEDRAFEGCGNLVVNDEKTLSSIGRNVSKVSNVSIKDETIDVKWKDVAFLDDGIKIPNQLGGWVLIKDENVDSSVNALRKHLSKMIPCLTVHFGQDGTPSIVNAQEFHDTVITLKIKNDLAALIRDGYEPSEILRKIDRLSQKHLREFIPRDRSPYINFLLQRHSADKYPLVPIKEYIGGAKEDGALYTIMIDGQPHIVWENNKDSRCTYVFRSSEEDYIETRQLVFDYILTEAKGKRKLLHTDKCLAIFKKKPRMVVHTNLKSWAQRLMCDSNLFMDAAATPSDGSKTSNIYSNLLEGEYVTRVEIQDIEGECDDADWQEYSISATALVMVKYNKVTDNGEENLITCTFSAHTTIYEEFDDDMSSLDIECDFEDIVQDRIDDLSDDDFEDLNYIDFHSQGVPVSGEGLSKDDIGAALANALDAYDIDWSFGEFECSKLFSEDMPSGDFESNE